MERLTDAERETAAANRGLVYSTVKAMGGPVDDDSIQAGMFGLMRAVQLFDPDRGFKFSTYASRWIRSAVMRHWRGDRLIHIPDYILTGSGGSTDPEKYSADADRASRVERIIPENADVVEPPAPPEPSLEDRELRAALAREIAGLPRVQRAIIEHTLAGDGRQTIADAVGIEKNKIGHQREVALKTLRGRLAAFA